VYNLIDNMNTTLPYDNCDLNIEYLIAKNQEVNTTSSMITVIFLICSIVMYSLFDGILINYRTRLIKLTKLVYLIDAVHNLNLELDDVDGLIECLEEQEEPVIDDSESVSDCGSDDEDSEGSQSEPINLMVHLDGDRRRVLRSQTRKPSNLDIKGNGWKLD